MYWEIIYEKQSSIFPVHSSDNNSLKELKLIKKKKKQDRSNSQVIHSPIPGRGIRKWVSQWKNLETRCMPSAAGMEREHGGQRLEEPVHSSMSALLSSSLSTLFCRNTLPIHKVLLPPCVTLIGLYAKWSSYILGLFSLTIFISIIMDAYN